MGSTTTTTAFVPRKDVLILSTMNKLNVPIITNASGREDRNFYFEYGEKTEVDRSCAITWRNEHYVFGGYSNDRQVSKIKSCKLERIGELSFSFFEATCTNVGDRMIYLCFATYAGNKICRFSDSPIGQFQEFVNSIYEHGASRIASSDCKDFLFQIESSHTSHAFLDDILAVGSYNPQHNKAEVLNTDRNTWSQIKDYPYDWG